MNKKQYCAITEQGDLGLGAEILSENDQNIMNRRDKNTQQQNKSKDNRNSYNR